MNKRLIIILGLVMALVLLSLITVQINWIRNAYMVKEKQFDQMVHQALSEMVNIIARDEAYNLASEEFYPTSGLQKTLSPKTTNLFDSLNNVRNYNSQQLINSSENISDSLIEKLQDNLNFSMQLNEQKKILEERQKYINRVLFRMLSYTPDIEERLNVYEVEAIANETLLDYGIDANFEFAVTKWNNTIAFNSETFTPDEHTSIYRVRLFPDDLSSETNYLDLYFPQKRNLIFRSLAFLGISSGVLTILIVFTFAFTLYVIFRQKRLSEIKNDFVNNMTHELKTPISTISLASQMLGDETIPSNVKNIPRISNIIKQETKRLGYQVEKVLQIASIDRGNLELNFKETNLHDLIENVVSNFTIQIDSKGGLLIPSLHAERSTAKVDPVHMANAVSNLVDNAIKYSPNNPEIFIETRNIDNEISIIVKDNGIGISRANQKKVFDRFYRVPTGNVHNVKGFGLGLNYVKKIIEMHKGILDLESELENGSTFTIKIPLFIPNTHGKN